MLQVRGGPGSLVVLYCGRGPLEELLEMLRRTVALSELLIGRIVVWVFVVLLEWWWYG